jgi:hypothetical protein
MPRTNFSGARFPAQALQRFTDIFQSFSLQSRNRDGIMADPG